MPLRTHPAAPRPRALLAPGAAAMSATPPHGPASQALPASPKLARGPAATATGLLAKVADAIHYLHTHGAVHRDIKPSNVLLDERGEPYVSDFGLVKVLADSSDLSIVAADLSRSRDVKGTPAYMAPEQAGGA